MLSRDDSLLAQRDSALPGLASLLDDERMLEIVRGLSRDVDVRSLEANYVRYKPATSAIVGYSVQLPGATIPIYARTHGKASRSKLGKAVHRPGPAGPLGFGVAAIRNPELAIFEVPNDDELRSLPRLITAHNGRLGGADATVGEHSLAGAAITTLRYKPERRFVARVDAAEAVFVLKIYTEEDYAAIRKRGKQFASADNVIVPEPAGQRSRHFAILFDWIDGTALLDLARRDRSAGLEAAGRVGGALATIHQTQPSKQVPKCDPACIRAWLDGAIAAIEDLNRTAGSALRGVAEGVMAAIGAQPWQKSGLHGDFGHDQVLIVGDRIVAFDFDRAMRGHPLVDVGRFAASLELEACRGAIDDRLRGDLLAAMVSGYTDKAALPEEAVRSFAAAQLLMRAHEPFRQRWPGWMSAMTRLLQRAMELSGSACRAGQ